MEEEEEEDDSDFFSAFSFVCEEDWLEDLDEDEEEPSCLLLEEPSCLLLLDLWPLSERLSFSSFPEEDDFPPLFSSDLLDDDLDELSDL
ncbi:MAG: hypothetical protein GY694_12220 [Gammaproteobacteria bacterium]|nr:hypothetical protein [Gammaproteobacteria bacterium]